MKTEKLKRVLILPDSHTPYHDKRALEKLIMGKVIPGGEWDTLVVLGDWFDNYILSTFTKDPRRLEGLLKELKPGFGLLDELKGAGFKRRIFIEGNHEKRLPKMVSDKAPEFYEILMEWWERHFEGWEYVPYMEDIQVGKMNFTHDVGFSGALSARQSMHAYQDNAVIGHNHNMVYCVEGNASGILHVGASFGWLGDVTKIDYRHRMRARREWALGFGYGHLRSNGFMYLHPAPIINYTAVVDGILYQA